MAHEVETMAYAHEVPWHGLGARVDGNIGVDEMLVAAGLDWQVKKARIVAEIEAPDGSVERKSISGRHALVRSSDNSILTVCGEDWHPMQNATLLGLMRDYVEAGGVTLETAGSLRRGRTVWGLAELKHGFEVSRGDRVNGYLLLICSHEAGRAHKVFTTTVRVVCANTMRLATESNLPTYIQNHLSEFDVTAARAAIEGSHAELSAAAKRAKTIKALRISMEDAAKKVLIPVFAPTMADAKMTLNEMIDTNKTMAELIYSINSGPGADPGTGWGVLNGVTYWADHIHGRTSETRMQKSWMGTTGKQKLEVESKLLALAS